MTCRASVSYSGNTATINPNADLDSNGVYVVTVAGTVADTAGNPLGADDTWTFTAAPLSFGFVDDTAAEFGAGTPGADTYVSETANGEVTLKPTVGEEFSGDPGLPAGLVEQQRAPVDAGGTATVSGGSPPRRRRLREHRRHLRARPLARVQGDLRRRHRSSTSASPTTSTPIWAMFSTRNSTSQLYASTNPGSIQDSPIGSGEPVRRLLASLPDRVGRDRGSLLHRRRLGADRMPRPSAPT